MADVAPKQPTTPRQRAATLIRSLGSNLIGEKRNAFSRLEAHMRGMGMSWSDIGNDVEHGGKPNGDGKFSEAEMQELAQVARAQGVEAGIKIGQAQAQATSNGHANGNSITLPFPKEMAEHCHHHQQLNRMKDNERQFIKEMYAKTLSGVRLKRPMLGYLASLYIKYDGRL